MEKAIKQKYINAFSKYQKMRCQQRGLQQFTSVYKMLSFFFQFMTILHTDFQRLLSIKDNFFTVSLITISKVKVE